MIKTHADDKHKQLVRHKTQQAIDNTKDALKTIDRNLEFEEQQGKKDTRLYTDLLIAKGQNEHKLNMLYQDLKEWSD